MTRKVLRFTLVLSLLWSGGSGLFLHAQVQEARENTGAAAAWQALLRLRTTATVLHTTAHPDDEDGGLLTWLSRGQGVRTGLLTLTRGEGGANLLGPDAFDALGLLRTEELLAAGRYYHVDQFFTRVTDFGFSKRLEETLEHWGRETMPTGRCASVPRGCSTTWSSTSCQVWRAWWSGCRLGRTWQTSGAGRGVP
jgi:hypothetical protein